MTFNSISACQCSSYLHTITPIDVCNAIHDVKENRGPGLDGIETTWLKLALHILIHPLADLFNLSLCTCEIPGLEICTYYSYCYSTHFSISIWFQIQLFHNCCSCFLCIRSWSSHRGSTVFVDLARAFDLVDHHLLLATLRAIGLSRHALLWCNPFVHNRK